MNRPTHRQPEQRPLRWMKFAAGVAAAVFTLSLAEPAVRLFTQIVAGPFALAPPLPALLPSLLSALVAVAGLGWLIADASFDRILPRWSIALLFANLLLLSLARIPLDLPEAAGDAAAASALRQVKVQAEEHLGAGAAYVEGIRDLMERAGKLPETLFRDRLFRTVAARLVVLEDRDGPLFSIPEGTAPATIFLAINPSQSAAWLTATTLKEGQVSLLRDGGLPVVIGVPLCPKHTQPTAPLGGSPC